MGDYSIISSDFKVEPMLRLTFHELEFILTEKEATSLINVLIEGVSNITRQSDINQLEMDIYGLYSKQ